MKPLKFKLLALFITLATCCSYVQHSETVDSAILTAEMAMDNRPDSALMLLEAQP